MTSNLPESTVDTYGPRFSQALVVLLTAGGFALQQPWLVVLTFTILTLAVMAGPSASAFTQIYLRFVEPHLPLSMATEFESAAPHRFHEGVEVVLLGAATFCLIVGWSSVGWGLSLVVTGLAFLAATGWLCLGCVLHGRMASS